VCVCVCERARARVMKVGTRISLLSLSLSQREVTETICSFNVIPYCIGDKMLVFLVFEYHKLMIVIHNYLFHTYQFGIYS
jgi:hypothetical protein